MVTTYSYTLQIRQEFITLMTDMYAHDVGNELSLRKQAYSNSTKNFTTKKKKNEIYR